MKKILFLAIPLCAVILAGCSSTDVAVKNEKQSQTESVTTQSNEEISKTEATTFAAINEDVEPSELIPDPKDYFKDATVNIFLNDESYYHIEVLSYDDSEYETFINQCKKMGFTNLVSEKKTNDQSTYWAYSYNGKYSIYISAHPDDNKISIQCEKNTNLDYEKRIQKTNYSELIPNPKEYFKDATVNILWNDESSYSVEVTSYSLDEFEAYISKCKEMGFTQIEYEYRKIENNSGYFWANTKDNKYSLDVTTNSLNGTISITCGEND